MSDRSKTVSLVLGSGGARGLAHIGIIHELKERGFEIASISGCSIGALIGGVYAAGKLDEFEGWIRAITKKDIVSLLDMSWTGDGLIKGDKIIDTLVELIGDKTIEELPIPFTAMAVDIKNEKEVWLNSGRLFDAIRASISLPLFFTPVRYKDIHLIDGGVLNPVPIAPTFGDDTDLTIAVNLSGPPIEKVDPTGEQQQPAEISSPLSSKVREFFRDLQSSEDIRKVDSLGAYDVANQSFDTMQGAIARQKLAAYPPDILIEIARNACGMFAFDCAAEMIEIGTNAASERLSRVSPR
jgi:NTE family protein